VWGGGRRGGWSGQRKGGDGEGKRRVVMETVLGLDVKDIIAVEIFQ